jgi:hypothetical protein
MVMKSIAKDPVLIIRDKKKNKYNLQVRNSYKKSRSFVKDILLPPGGGTLYAVQIVCVGFHWFRVKARENPFRFEMLHRTTGNPTTVNRVRQPAAKMKIPIQGT